MLAFDVSQTTNKRNVLVNNLHFSCAVKPCELLKLLYWSTSYFSWFCLIYLLWGLFCLLFVYVWLARVITLVLGLQHSNEMALKGEGLISYTFFKFQLYGASAIIHFITAVCHCGLCKITDVHCVSKSGLCRGLEDNSRLQWKLLWRNCRLPRTMPRFATVDTFLTSQDGRRSSDFLRMVPTTIRYFCLVYGYVWKEDLSKGPRMLFCDFVCSFLLCFRKNRVKENHRTTFFKSKQVYASEILQKKL